jgi:hypothetical protein
MNHLDPTWHSFQCCASAAQAAAFSENCLFSLSTLEIDSPADATSFALTEQELPGIWRWAIVNASGQVIDHGSEPTQACAKLASARAPRLAV